MIEVSQLSKAYTLTAKQRKELRSHGRSVQAVQDVSFTCQPGRVFSLLGPNGAGKTTTLRMIATLLKPTGGAIRVQGFDTVVQSRDVRRSIGFLTGSTNLYERLTPTEAVDYFGKLHGMDLQVLNKRRNELFERLGIQEYAAKRIGQLSTGMKQKVSIARSMIHDPAVVIFDEPTSGLDVISAGNIIELIHECRAAGKTVIFSSHIMSEVDLLCDDLAIMHQGKICFAGTMQDFRDHCDGQSLTECFIRVVKGVSA